MASRNVHAVIANSFSTLHTTARRAGTTTLQNDKIRCRTTKFHCTHHNAHVGVRDFQLGMVEYCLHTTGLQNCSLYRLVSLGPSTTLVSFNVHAPYALRNIFHYILPIILV